MSNKRDQLQSEAVRLGIETETYPDCDALYLRNVRRDLLDSEEGDSLYWQTLEHNVEAIKQWQKG